MSKNKSFLEEVREAVLRGGFVEIINFGPWPTVITKFVPFEEILSRIGAGPEYEIGFETESIYDIVPQGTAKFHCSPGAHVCGALEDIVVAVFYLLELLIEEHETNPEKFADGAFFPFSTANEMNKFGLSFGNTAWSEENWLKQGNKLYPSKVNERTPIIRLDDEIWIGYIDTNPLELYENMARTNAATKTLKEEAVDEVANKDVITQNCQEITIKDIDLSTEETPGTPKIVQQYLTMEDLQELFSH